jgi:hypothetical protein
MAYTKYSLTPANNTAAPPDGAPEGMLPSAVNDTMRDMMAQIRDCGDGIRDGTYTMTAPKITGGTITGSTINNSAIGGTTAAAGAFTTLSATGATTFSGATVVSASLTANTFSSSGATITGGTINSTAIGGSTASTGKFTTLEATGVTTVQAGTVSLPAITTTGDTNTGIFFPAADTIAFAEGGAEAMRIDSSGNTTFAGSVLGTSETFQVGVNSSGKDTRFGVLSGGNGRVEFYSAGSERMRIDTSGNVLVGTTSVLGKISLLWNSSTQQGLVLKTTSSTFNGYPVIFYNNADVASGLITQAQNSVTYGTSSDYRLKENITPMTGALAKVSALKPVTYKWKSDGSDGQGFIAHELQAVVPDCVNGEKDAVETYTDEDGNEQTRIKPQSVDTSFLVATLTAAIQELKAELDATKAEVQALKGV